MTNRHSILIISDEENMKYWQPMLEVIRRRIGPTTTIFEKDVLNQGFFKPSEIIVVDATDVASLPQLVRFIHDLIPEGKIIIVTATPTWKQAREAFHIGATDYIQKRYDKEEMANVLESVLEK